MIRKLKIKFVAINMFLVFLVFCITFYIIFSFYSKTLESRNLRELENIIDMSISDFVRMSETDTSEARSIQFTPLFIATVDPKDGNIISLIKSNVSIDDDDLNHAVQTAVNNKTNSGEIKSLNLRFLKKANPESIKISFMDISRETASKASLLLVLFFTLCFALLAFLLISIILSSIALKPVATTWNAQKQFIADASHELKTPLTVLLANMDILENNSQDTIKNQEKWINGSKQVALNMKNLIEEMLFLAKSDAGKINLSLEKVDVSDTLVSKILSMEAIAYEKNISMDYDDIEENLFTKADEKQLSQIFAILIDNALKYSYENTTINYHLKKEQDKIKFAINNKGDIISKEDSKYIFERFYRVDKSRSREKGGYGLGLSIAKKIADENKIRIWVESDNENSTTFYLSMAAIKS